MNYNNIWKRFRLAARALSVAAIVLAGPAAGRAAIINVPNDQPTIQAGIDAANNGDTVVVAPGTYINNGNCNINTNDKAITIESTGATIGLSGTDEPAFVIDSGESSSTIISGFTIDLEAGTNESPILIDGASPTIENCTFETNESATNGGAISVIDSSPTIEQCTFAGNGAEAAGGAIYIENNNTNDRPMIKQCLFEDNVTGDTVSTPGFGGAIEVQVNPSARTTTVDIINCSFVGNTATYDGGAIDARGISASDPTVNIVNCSFSGNQEDGDVDGDSNLLPPTVSKVPGAIDSLLATTNLTNCVMWGDSNSITLQSGGVVNPATTVNTTEYSTLNPGADGANTAGTVSIEYSDLEESMTLLAADISGSSSTFQSSDDIDSDPLYVDPTSDNLALQYNSPAINIGATASTNALVPGNDLLGNTRDANPDMGAYEYVINAGNDAISPAENTAFSGEVATFNDSAADTTPVGQLTATINWGDSTSSAGVITQPGGVGTAYSVSGSHTYTSAGKVTLTVTIMANTNTPSVTGQDSTSITVQAVATQLVVSAPSVATAGTSINFTVTAEDASNDVVTGYSGTVNFSTTDSAITPPASTTLTNGTGTFPITFHTAGTQTITATDSANSLTGTSGDIDVSAGTATHFQISGGPQPFYTDTDVTINALDQYGNLATTYNGTIGLTSNNPGFSSFGPYTGFTNGSLVTEVAFRTAGTDTVTATDTSNSSITGTGSFTVPPGATSHFEIDVPSSVNIGSSFQITVKAEDLYNNLTPAYNGTFTFSSSTDPNAVLPSGPQSLTNGTGTFTVTLNTGGSNTITATDAANSITSTSNALEVLYVASLAVSPGPSETYTLPVVQQFTATAYDQFGNPYSPQPQIYWGVTDKRVGSISYTGGLYYGGPVPGTATVVASTTPLFKDPASVQGTSSVTLLPSPVTVAQAASVGPSPTIHTRVHLNVLGAYAGTGSEPSLTYSWSVSGGSGSATYSDNNDNTARTTTATLTATGTYLFTVTITSPVGTSTTSSVSATINPTPGSITVSPAGPLTMNVNTTQQFTATAYDQFGNLLSPQPAIGWSLVDGSVGSVSHEGMYHGGPSAGSATVLAHVGAIVSSGVGVTVN